MEDILKKLEDEDKKIVVTVEGYSAGFGFEVKPEDVYATDTALIVIGIHGNTVMKLYKGKAVMTYDADIDTFFFEDEAGNHYEMAFV